MGTSSAAMRTAGAGAPPGSPSGGAVSGVVAGPRSASARRREKPFSDETSRAGPIPAR